MKYFYFIYLLGNLYVFSHVGYQTELNDINRKLKKTPHNQKLLLKRAYLLRLLKKYDQAHTQLSFLIQKFPKNTAFYFQRALVYKEMGKWKKAEQDLTQIVRWRGHSGQVFAQRARIRTKLKKFIPALSDYKKGSFYRQNENFYLDYGYLWQKMENEKKASQTFAVGISKWPYSIALNEALALSEIKLKHYLKAHQIIAPFLKKRSFKAPWLLLKGKIYHASGNPKEAVALWKKALQECIDRMNSGKGNVIHLTYQVEVLLALGERSKAKNILGTILQEHPHYFRALQLWQKMKAD